MYQVNIKPLSVNQSKGVVRGRVIKSKEYRQYEKDVYVQLPKMEVPKKELLLSLEFGFSNKQSDIDNPVKPFQDILQKKYGFNDSQIYALSVVKKIVPKGQEFIKFEIAEAQTC